MQWTFDHLSGDLLPCRTVTGARTIRTVSVGKEAGVKAKVGDWLVLKCRTVEAAVVPGPDAIVVTAAEQDAADGPACSRVPSVQTAITHPTRSE